MTFMEHLEATRILKIAEQGGFFEDVQTTDKRELNERATTLLRGDPRFEQCCVLVDWRRGARGKINVHFRVYGGEPPEGV